MIKVTSETNSGSGSNGLYWRYDKHTGIKLCLSTDYQTKREGNWLKKLNEIAPRIFPKFYGFLTVDFDGVKCLAYRMEHIEGSQIMAHTLPNLLQKKVDFIIKKLQKAKIEFGDIDGNVIITKRNSVRLIDADPNYFLWKGKRP